MIKLDTPLERTNNKIGLLYERAKDRWVSVQEMGNCVGLDGAGHSAIMRFVHQPDVEVKEEGGIRVYRTKR
jgi:hypothetical protein